MVQGLFKEKKIFLNWIKIEKLVFFFNNKMNNIYFTYLEKMANNVYICGIILSIIIGYNYLKFNEMTLKKEFYIKMCKVEEEMDTNSDVSKEMNIDSECDKILNTPENMDIDDEMEKTLYNKLCKYESKKLELNSLLDKLVNLQDNIEKVHEKLSNINI